MNDEFPERELLRTIDPAPRAVSDGDRLRNLNEVLRRVEDARARPPRRPGPLLRGAFWLRIAVPVGLAAAAAAVVVPLAFPEGGGAPGIGVVQSAAIRVGTTTDAGVRILANTTVGSAQFLLGRRGDDIRSGASFRGSDPDDNWETFGAPREVASDDFTLVNPGNFPDAAPGGIATVTGQVGADVTGLDIRTHAGDVVAATIVDGYYIAAWEGRDFDGVDTLDAEFLLHLADGSTTRVPYAQASEEGAR
ncbi:hypothetical protein N1027_14405 [Herbiconiux sp. CPCC 205763]|uniref:Uncharacterized protein n=1 Tax=Herbiconiux aconitum TaxID=2970913 RepID=A0ABT2GWQ2_9MICO|nr:hypothetical protein [Herbiconiux aconitum]MCS5719326.1 hypothetical protein [Herbiconiux aconitum]